MSKRWIVELSQDGGRTWEPAGVLASLSTFGSKRSANTMALCLGGDYPRFGFRVRRVS